MHRLGELEARIADEGIVGLSWGVFTEHTRPNGRVIKANTSVREYCEKMGQRHGCSAESYADEILKMMDAPATTVVGECMECCSFILEGEEHQCDPVRLKEKAELDALFAKVVNDGVNS